MGLSYYEFEFEAMASDCQLKFYAPSAALADDCAQLAIDEVLRIEARYSRYRTDSALSQINARLMQGLPVTLDSETAALVRLAFEAYHLSDGLFDISSGALGEAWSFRDASLPTEQMLTQLLPRVGMAHFSFDGLMLRPCQPQMMLDFGGIGKEYAVDRLASIFQEQGIGHGLIALGGDIRVLGPHADGSAWHIAIRDPRQLDQAIGRVALAQGAIATSGDYERYKVVDGQRYCHILHPKTGLPVTDVRAVSVIAAQCLTAGVLSTIGMLKGKDALRWFNQHQCVYWLEDVTGRRHESASLSALKRSS